MITRNIKEYFLPFLFCGVEASIAINKLKLLTLDSFSVTDIYRNILETALKSVKKNYGKLACTSYRKVTFLNIKKKNLLEVLCQY